MSGSEGAGGTSDGQRSLRHSTRSRSRSTERDADFEYASDGSSTFYNGRKSRGPCPGVGGRPKGSFNKKTVHSLRASQTMLQRWHGTTMADMDNDDNNHTALDVHVPLDAPSQPQPRQMMRPQRALKPSGLLRDEQTFRERDSMLNTLTGNDMVGHMIRRCNKDPNELIALLKALLELVDGQPDLAAKVKAAFRIDEEMHAQLQSLLGTEKWTAEKGVALMAQLHLSQEAYHILRMSVGTDTLPTKQAVLKARKQYEAVLQKIQRQLEDGTACTGWARSDIQQHVLQPEMDEFFQQHPDRLTVDIKIGGDNFEIKDHSGAKGRFFEQISMYALYPGQASNRVGGQRGGARILAIFEARESEEVIRTLWTSVEQQLVDELTINGTQRKIRYWLSADYKFACTLLGHQGQASTHFCLWCTAMKKDLEQIASLQQFQAGIHLRTAKEMEAVGLLAEKYMKRNPATGGLVLDVNAAKCDRQVTQQAVNAGIISRNAVGAAPSITSEIFDQLRKSVYRACMSKLVSILRYVPEVLHCRINIINNMYDYSCKIAAQLDIDLDAVMESLGMKKPVTRYEGNMVKKVAQKRDMWLPKLQAHPLYPTLNAAWTLVSYMLMVAGLPAPSLTDGMLDAYDSAAESFMAILREQLPNEAYSAPYPTIP